MTHDSGSAVRHVVFVFLDGVGIGTRQDNPFWAAHMPFLDTLLAHRRPTLCQPALVTDRAAAFPVDACLGVAGRPQSATGQAAIVSGRNVPRALQEHYGPKPDRRIRALLDQGTLFTRLRQAGLAIGSANAYPPPYFRGISSGKRLPSAIPYAWQAAGISLNNVADYRRQEAIAGSLTGREWRIQLGLDDVPVHTPEQAGRIVGARARVLHFLFFEHWLTDIHGHRQMYPEAVRNFEAIDRFLQGVTESVDLDRTLIIVGSDHGNVEDCSHGRHTCNPTLGLMWGAGCRAAARSMRDLTDFRPVIEKCLLA